jgi:hypothetical protein
MKFLTMAAKRGNDQIMSRKNNLPHRIVDAHRHPHTAVAPVRMARISTTTGTNFIMVRVPMVLAGEREQMGMVSRVGQAGIITMIRRMRTRIVTMARQRVVYRMT